MLLPGRFPYSPQHFAHIGRAGVDFVPVPAEGVARWMARLEHPTFGTARIVALREPFLPPRPIAEHSSRLRADERAAVLRSGSSVFVSCDARSGNVLSDRKDLLRALHLVLGEHGLAAYDLAAEDFWSRDALEDELAHGAELDIESIYSLHLVRPDGGGAPYWLHSHGLRDVGCSEFDILDPAPDLISDHFRALAFAVVEGSLVPGGGPAPLLPDASIRAVPVSEFMARAPSDAHTQWRESLDPDHEQGHAVLCDPRRAGWLARALKRDVPVAARVLREPHDEDRIVYFSRSASDLMARRAQQTVPLLREAREDLADLDVEALVKLAFPVDDGSGHEHLWFEVHAIESDAVDATLLSHPLDIEGLRAGQRGRHALDRMSDWMLSTPIGQVTPRQTRGLRVLRARRDEIRDLLRGSPSSERD